MRFKRFALVLAYIGVAFLALAAVPGTVKLFSASNEVYGLLKTMVEEGLTAVLRALGIAAVITGLLWQRYCWGENAICPAKTSLLSVGMAASGVVWFWGCINCFFMSVFSKPSDYPREFPFYGTLCFAGFLVLAGLSAWYYFSRKKCWSAKGFALDIFIGILWVLPFLYLLGKADYYARKIFL